MTEANHASIRHRLGDLGDWLTRREVLTDSALARRGEQVEATMNRIEYRTSHDSGVGSIDPSTMPKQVPEALQWLNQRYAFIRSPVAIKDLATNDLHLDQRFRQLLANLKVHVANEKGDVKLQKVAPLWLEWEGRREYTGLAYEPGKPIHLPDGQLNLWRGWSVQPQEGDVTLWCQLMEHLFPQDEGARRWFEQWCAFPFQHPGVKLYTAVLFWGAQQGGGKSLTGEIVGAIYGSNYCELGPGDLESQFNDWAANRQFALVNELLSSGRAKDRDLLKTLITREKVTVNRKYEPKYTVRDCLAYFLTSNHPNALYLEDSDRRFFVHEVRQRLDRKLADDISAWGKSPLGSGALLHHFQHLDLTGFSPRDPAPDTAAKRDMIEASRSDLELFIHDKIEAARIGEGEQLVTAEEIREEFNGTSTYPATLKAVGLVLQKCGALNLGQKRLPGTKERPRLWALADAERWKTATPLKIAEQIRPGVVQ